MDNETALRQLQLKLRVYFSEGRFNSIESRIKTISELESEFPGFGIRFYPPKDFTIRIPGAVSSIPITASFAWAETG